MPGVEKWPHAHPVAGKQHASSAAVPKSKGEVAIEARQAFVAIGGIELEQDFRIAAGAEAVSARLQLVPQLDIVEDLAVEGDDDVAVLARHRLLTVHKADDRETDMGKPDAGDRERAAPVRPAMGNRIRHGCEER